MTRLDGRVTRDGDDATVPAAPGARCRALAAGRSLPGAYCRCHDDIGGCPIMLDMGTIDVGAGANEPSGKKTIGVMPGCGMPGRIGAPLILVPLGCMPGCGIACCIGPTGDVGAIGPVTGTVMGAIGTMCGYCTNLRRRASERHVSARVTAECSG